MLGAAGETNPIFSIFFPILKSQRDATIRKYFTISFTYLQKVQYHTSITKFNSDQVNYILREMAKKKKEGLTGYTHTHAL